MDFFSFDCEFCGGPCGLMGVLGRMAHCQCRDCGMECSRAMTKEEVRECKLSREEPSEWTDFDPSHDAS